MQEESSVGNAAPPEAAGNEAVQPAPARYDFAVDPESHSTHAEVIRLVGNGKRVLELGPATGYVTAVLRDHGCTVIGIELDEEMAERARQYSERVIVGDVEDPEVLEGLAEDRFDVIVAADVLEHLRDPLDVLRRLRPLLADDGYFVVSVPNIAHGSVRLALLEGQFRYRDAGLLDTTHLRFFTRDTLQELFDEADTAIVEVHRQELNIDASEVTFDPAGVPPELLERLRHDPEAWTYQFVVKAIPMSQPGMRALQQRFAELAVAKADAEIELDRLRRIDLAELARREAQLRAAVVQAHEQLLRRDEEIQRMLEEVPRLGMELAARDAQLTALQVRLDRILKSPPARAYERVKGLPIVRDVVKRRTAGYDSALAQAQKSDR